RFRRSWSRDFAGPISVVVAAYNEEKVIAETLRSLLTTDYTGELEVIVIDDGSIDRTAAEVEKIANSDPRVRLLRQPNHGKARAWTEAPETVKTLARQRFRWAYGTLQCLWKHRDMVFNWNYRALGWFSLPSVWFFQIILVAITPMVDLFLLASLAFGAWSALLPFVIVFLGMDVLLATLACIIERESIFTAWRI